MSPPRPHDREENQDGEEASQESRLAKRPRRSSCCDDKQELLEEMRKMLQRQNEMLQKIESMYQENLDLRGEVSCLKADMSRLNGCLQQYPAPRMLSDHNCSIPLQLKFLNSCKNDKYSTRKIQADDETPLKVAICNHNNKIIGYEPFSSMRVQIVPIHSDFDNDLEGQWTEEYFRTKIVTGRPGKENLLYGDLYIKLQDGVGYLNSAKFQDNSSFVASRRFKLGVMAADQRISQRIQEGITEAFVVKDVRGYSTKKILHPSPRDPVHKLSRIAPNGDRHKLLVQNGIKTVGDFYCFYMKSPDDLRKVLVKISDQEWDIITNHALKCNPRPEISSSFIEERNVYHEHETFSKSDGSCYLRGSCSTMRPSPAPQVTQYPAEPLDVLITQQQISWTNSELPPGMENVPCLLKEAIQTLTEEQASGLGDEFLSVSSMGDNALQGSSLQQRRRLAEFSTISDENVRPHVNPSVNNEELSDDFYNKLFGIETELMREQDIPRDNCFTEDSSCTHSFTPLFVGGRSSASEATSINYVGVSPARGADGRSSTRVSSPFGSLPRAAVPIHRPAIFRRAEISAETVPGHCTVPDSQPNAQRDDRQRPSSVLAASHWRAGNPDGLPIFTSQGSNAVQGAPIRGAGDNMS